MFGEMLVAGLLVVVVLKSWLVCFLFFDVFWGVVLEGGSKNNNGAADFVSTGVETTTSFDGGSQKTTTGLQFLSLGCGRGSKQNDDDYNDYY